MPEDRKDPASRPTAPSTSDGVTIDGMLRQAEPRGRFSATNDQVPQHISSSAPPSSSRVALRLPSTCDAMLCAPGTVLDYYVDMTGPVMPGRLPVPLAGRLQIPNRHLEYALTWYSLAATLLVIAGVATAPTHVKGEAMGDGTQSISEAATALRFPLPRGAFVVSCQARADNPLHGPVFMAAMARAAEQGGARGLRVNGADDIRAVRAVTQLPIIGIVKRFSDRHPVYITPDVPDAVVAATAGADIIAIDATARPRDGLPLADLIPAIKARTGKPVMADVATLEEGIAAARHGADAVATTLAGHTAETAHRKALAPTSTSSPRSPPHWRSR